MQELGDTVVLFGLKISRISYPEVCAAIRARVASKRPAYIVTPNVDHVCKCFRDKGFRNIYDKAFLALPDGVPILWAARLLGFPLPDKLSGSDMVPRLCEFAAEAGLSVFFFGGFNDTALVSSQRMRQRHPALKVAGVYSPPLGFEKNPQDVADAIGVLQSSGADLCFVALGSPKQEHWMHDRLDEIGIPVSIGVGGTFDFLSGRIPRAPHWMQRYGLEWFWRLCLEPRRLWRRYLLEDMLFFKLLFREFWSRRICGKSAPLNYFHDE